MNKVFLIGNLTRDVELATTSSGTSVARFSIAVQRRYANADGERGVDYFNIVVWRGQAENCSKYLSKGSKVAVEGRLQNGSYEAQDGTTRHTTDVVAEQVEFVGRKKSDNGDSGEGIPEDLQPVEDDNLPF